MTFRLWSVLVAAGGQRARYTREWMRDHIINRQFSNHLVFAQKKPNRFHIHTVKLLGKGASSPPSQNWSMLPQFAKDGLLYFLRDLGNVLIGQRKIGRYHEPLDKILINDWVAKFLELINIQEEIFRSASSIYPRHRRQLNFGVNMAPIRGCPSPSFARDKLTKIILPSFTLVPD